MTKRITSILLAAFIAVGFMPMLWQDAYATGASEIESLDLTITPPVAGAGSANATENVSIADTTGIEIYVAGWQEHTGVDDDDPDYIHFKEGQTYYALVYIRPAQGYNFKKGSQHDCDEYENDYSFDGLNVTGGSIESCGISSENYGRICALISVTATEAPATVVDSIEIAYSHPVCGIETTTQEDEDWIWDWDSQTNRPIVTVTNNTGWGLTKYDGYWEKDSSGADPYIGTFEGGKKYWAETKIYVKAGYKVSDSVAITVNGEAIADKCITVVNDDCYHYAELHFEIEAVHNMDDGTVTKQPTASENGEMTYKCKGCGTVMKTESLTFVKSIEITMTQPACGTETTTPKSTIEGKDYWDFDSQTNRPQITITNDTSWAYEPDDYDAYWVKDVSGDDPYIGTFEGGKKYLAETCIFVRPGNVVSDNVLVKVNGETVDASCITVENGYALPFAALHIELEAVHNMDDGTVTKQPTASENGVKTYKCTACGTVMKTESVSNASVKAVTYTPGKVTLKKVKKGSKKATVTWKTMKKATGYQICLTNTKTGKVKKVTVKQTKKLAKKKTISKTVKKLSKKTKYKVKVRAYRTVNGETFYGAWSKTKSVKVK